jgi:hypothetical protein
VRRCKIPIGVKLVGYTLAQYGNAYGTDIRPGFPRLAATCCMGQSTTRRHVDTLLLIGLIVRVSHGGGRARRAATYRLAIPEDIAERVPMLGPDEIEPLPSRSYSAHVLSGVADGYSAHPNTDSAHLSERSSDGYSAQSNPLLRSDDASTPLTQVSAHQGTHQAKEHQGGKSPQVSTSPDAPIANDGEIRVNGELLDELRAIRNKIRNGRTP